MSTEKWTPSRVKAKAEWEGGAYDLAVWGLKTEDIDDSTPEGAELARMWAALRACSPIVEAAEDYLDQLPDVEDEG